MFHRHFTGDKEGNIANTEWKTVVQKKKKKQRRAKSPIGLKMKCGNQQTRKWIRITII